MGGRVSWPGTRPQAGWSGPRPPVHTPSPSHHDTQHGLFAKRAASSALWQSTQPNLSWRHARTSERAALLDTCTFRIQCRMVLHSSASAPAAHAPPFLRMHVPGISLSAQPACDPCNPLFSFPAPTPPPLCAPWCNSPRLLFPATGECMHRVPPGPHASASPTLP